jgi:hypothetical protein
VDVLLLCLVLPLTLLFCSLLDLLVSQRGDRSRELLAIGHDRLGLGLDEDVPPHLLQETALAGLVDGLKNVGSRTRLAEVSHRCNRRVDTSVLTAQHTTRRRLQNWTLGFSVAGLYCPGIRSLSYQNAASTAVCSDGHRNETF